jgi:hypothetical protein
MNNALWSPRGARAGERTRTAGGTTLIDPFWVDAPGNRIKKFKFEADIPHLVF